MRNLRWKLAQALEIKWWRFYLGKQGVEDYLFRKKRYWEKILKKVDFSTDQEDTILDAGCGPAGIFIALPQQKMDAVDPLLKKYEAHLNHFKPAWYPWVTFHSVPLEKYTPEKQYDKVFCLNAINHVKDLTLCLQQLSKLTKEKGWLIISSDAHNFSFFKFLFRLLPGDMLHPHQFDIKEYCQMLETNHFVIHKMINLKKGFFFDYYLIVAVKKSS